MSAIPTYKVVPFSDSSVGNAIRIAHTTLRQMYGHQYFSDPQDLKILHEVVGVLWVANDLATKANAKNEEVMSTAMKAYTHLWDVVSRQFIIEDRWIPSDNKSGFDDMTIEWIMMRVSLEPEFESLNDILRAEWGYDDEE